MKKNTYVSDWYSTLSKEDKDRLKIKSRSKRYKLVCPECNFINNEEGD